MEGNRSKGEPVEGTTYEMEATMNSKKENSDNMKGQKKMESEEKDFIQYAEQFGDSTTLHGAQYILGREKHYLRRLIWLLVVILCLVWAFSTIYDEIVKYRKYQSTTKVSVEYNNPKAFPAVTLCNLNQWHRSGSRQETLDMVAMVYGSNQTLRDQFNWTAYHQTIGLTTRWNLTASALYPPIGAHSLHEMLLECLWNGGDKCDESDFDTVITDLGVCYTFNNPSNISDVRVVHKPGTDTGLTITLNIDHPEYVVAESQGAGIKMVLHPPGERPLLQESGFAISPGFETLVSAKYKKTTALTRPFASNCTDSGLKYSNVYTHALCLQECKVDYVVKICGCRDYRYPKASSSILCEPEDMAKCTIPAEHNATKITCSCPISCSSAIYEGRLSSNYWPALPTQEALIKAYPDKFHNTTEIRDNLLRMKIYYEELSSNLVEEIPLYGLQSLQSDIGGTLGLLCGMSIITVVEFIDFICICILNGIWKVKGKPIKEMHT